MPNEQAVTARADTLEAALQDIRGICKRAHFAALLAIERRCDAAPGEAPTPGRLRVEVTSECVVRGATYWISTHQRPTGHTTTVLLADPSPSTQGATIYEATGDDAGAQARHDAAVAWVVAGRPGDGPVRGEGDDADA